METLIIIDPQNDFCDYEGSLHVMGALDAIQNIIKYIEERNPGQIIVTLDTHNPLHMGLPGSWDVSFDKLPAINPDPIHSKHGLPVQEYARKLRTMGLPFIVWPDHCIKGTWGHSIPLNLSKVLTEWSIKNMKDIQWIEKGQGNFTEMYSAFSELGSTEVKVPKIIGDKVTMCGVALDYCVKYSYLDLKKEGYNINLFLPGTAAIGEVESYWKD